MPGLAGLTVTEAGPALPIPGGASLAGGETLTGLAGLTVTEAALARGEARTAAGRRPSTLWAGAGHPGRGWDWLARKGERHTWALGATALAALLKRLFVEGGCALRRRRLARWLGTRFRSGRPSGMGLRGSDDPRRGRASRYGGSATTGPAFADSRSWTPLFRRRGWTPLRLARCRGTLDRSRLRLRCALRVGCSRRGRLGPRGGRLLGMSVPTPVGRLVAADSVTSDLAPDAVRLGILDAGGMALYAYAHVVAQIYCAFVRQPQLFGEFINSNPLGQLLLLPSQKHFSIIGKMPPRTPPPAYWRFGGDCGRESACTILHGLLLSPSSRSPYPSSTEDGATLFPRAEAALAMATGSIHGGECRWIQ